MDNLVVHCFSGWAPPPTSRSRPPSTFVSTWRHSRHECSQVFPVFCWSSTPVYYCECKRKVKMGEAYRTKLAKWWASRYWHILFLFISIFPLKAVITEFDMLHLWASVKGGAHTCFIDVPDINVFAKCTWTLPTLIRSQVLQCSDVLEIHDG